AETTGTVEHSPGSTRAPTTEVLPQDAMTINGDSPVAFSNMTVDHEGNFPQKRRAQAVPTSQPAAGTSPVTVEAIAQALREELQAGFATQQSRLSKEIREEIGDAMLQVNKRIEAVEKGVTRQLQQVFTSVQELSVCQEKQAVTLVQTGAETQQLVRRVLALEEQLAKLENRPSPTGTTEEPTRRPAFIVGGWDSNQEAKQTLDKAKAILKDLQADVDLEDAFVPGLRRGYIIVPMVARPQETGEEMRGRIQQAVLRVRTANIELGTKEDGSPSRLWMAVSQPPERRKKAQLAAKTKRLLLELHGDHGRLDVEWSTGSVWHKDVKVASTSGTRPASAVEAGPGWIDLKEIAKQLRTEGDTVKDTWKPLAARLR
ncbi:unnamed protein product, partial [Symbiodinium necroappetens]